MSLHKKVSTVIPNYNGRKLLKKNLPLIIECLRDGDELIIVDDASTDDSVDWLKKWSHAFPNNKLISLLGEVGEVWQGEVNEASKKIAIIIVELHRNVRFARAVNAGVRVATAPFLLLLNNDVVPNKNLLSVLLPHTTGKKLFAVGCLEINSHLNNQVSGKNKLWFAKGMFWHQKADDMSSGLTAWASGGSGLFVKSKWMQLGGFDSRFAPAYWEDVDLSFRATKRGWRVIFDEQAIVEHRHETTNKNVFGEKRMRQMSWRSAVIFTHTHARGWQQLQFWLWRPYWFAKFILWHRSV